MAQLSGGCELGCIRCPQQLVVGGEHRDGEGAAAGVLSTFYVLILVFLNFVRLTFQQERLYLIGSWG